MTSETYPSGALRPAFRRAMWERDGGVCGLCGQPADPVRFDLDRIVPGAKGGSYHAANVRVTHPRCNRSRGVGEYRDPPAPFVTLVFKLEPEMHDELVRIAKDEERSLAGQIKLYLKRALEERQVEHGRPPREPDRGE